MGATVLGCLESQGLAPAHLGSGSLCFPLASWTCWALGRRDSVPPCLDSLACREEAGSEDLRARVRAGQWGGTGRASPLASALPEHGHPRIQLLLVSHLKDDVCPVLHLEGRKGSCVSLRGVSLSPAPEPQSPVVTHLEHEGMEVVRHLQACTPPDLLDARAGCLQLGL